MGLGTAKFEVVDGDFGLQRDEQVLHIGLGGSIGGLGGFHGATHAAEEVEFVIGVESGAPGIDGATAEGGIHGGAELCRVVGAAGGDRGREVELSFTPQGAGFEQA